MDEFTADYVVIGAGSAGCVVTNRLSADPSCKVLVIEAGGDDRILRNPRQAFANAMIRIPAGFTRTLKNAQVSWQYMAEPEPGLGGRQIAFPRGKVLGGSSALNGLLWVRGLPQDYDGWRQSGCEGWGWSDVKPIFERIERSHGRATREAGVDLQLSTIKGGIIDEIIEAFRQAGAPVLANLNNDQVEGVAPLYMTARRGLRRSSAATYLHPAMERSNVQVLTHTQVQRILFDGKRAIGVACEQNGRVFRIGACREVILCAGAIGSPQILELSGIGQGDRLKALGVEVIAHSPQVGENLQDHYGIAISARFKPGAPSFNRLTRGLPLMGQLMKYAFARSGILASASSNVSAFLKSDPALDLPDLQFFSAPFSVDVEQLAAHGRMNMEKLPGMTIGSYAMRPRSKGHIHIRSADHRQPPAIVPNFLSDEADERITVAGLQWCQSVLKQPALAAYFDRITPEVADTSTYEGLAQYARMAGTTGYHQCGTCAMGSRPDDVVDAQLRVNGVSNLRVADASVMPSIVSGNTNAPAIMIGEKAAAMILAAQGRTLA